MRTAHKRDVFQIRMVLDYFRPLQPPVVYLNIYQWPFKNMRWNNNLYEKEVVYIVKQTGWKRMGKKQRQLGQTLD